MRMLRALAVLFFIAYIGSMVVFIDQHRVAWDDPTDPSSSDPYQPPYGTLTMEELEAIFEIWALEEADAYEDAWWEIWEAEQALE